MTREASEARISRAWQRPRVIAALLVRETCARFGAAWGGYVWAIAEPLGGIVLLSVAFSYLVQKPPVGTSFMFFYATGLIPFLAYNSVANGAMSALVTNRGLLAYPVVTALDTILARALLDTLTYIVIAAIFFPGLIAALHLHVAFDPASFALSLALAAALGLGVGTTNALVAGIFPAWRHVWSVLNRPMFLISGVVFTFDTVPPDLRTVLWLNPVSHPIAVMRAAFYGPDEGLYASVVYVAAVALALFVAGGFLIGRNQSRIVAP